MVAQRIAVFGGSGHTGRAVIAAAGAAGAQVRALYRPGSEPQAPAQGLETVIGQLTATEDVARTLEGVQGAILVFGPRLNRNVRGDVFCARATETIVSGMRAQGVERIICQTGAMAGGDNPNWSWAVHRFVLRYRRTFPEVDRDRDAQEVAVRESGLDWTIARPFRISSARATGRVRTGRDLRIGMLTSVRRDDLAAFLVSEALAGRYHRQAVYVVT